ncbi:hypothetical protein Q4Q34_02900 [Flavivirga abyssicola]|uniref:hypothetical protein n=1 Tax=Flavivirga abyssicola TaxID=3063533 RepID=UPI0026E06E40|nr:hypothetical protein [Flavivirga sp. MEBiC07777]WVK13984.1 hypothetical protein Q4Q34_02900 [Flavivirga sp. MEBiC07777]
MKEKLLNSFKRLHQKSATINDIVIALIYATVVSLSIINNNLFLEEILLCGLIIGMTLLSAKNKNSNK